METQIGPAKRPVAGDDALFQCNICLASKPKEVFPFLPCCSNRKVNHDACASCVAMTLTIPTDNKCPRCREFVQLVDIVTSGRPPYRIIDVSINLGSIEKCLSCGAMKRLIHPSRICKDCQRFKNNNSMPQLLYECQVCHQEQQIPYPIYKTQQTPRHYGNPAWWPCNNACGGKLRRWRIVEGELSKLGKESAPHSWAQYFVRKELNCLPEDPAKITTETKLTTQGNGRSMAVGVGPGRFVADEVDSSGTAFLVPSQHFPIAEPLEDDNDEWLAKKTTLRLRNERNHQIYAVLAHWLPNGYVHCRLISNTEEGSKSIDTNKEIKTESAGPLQDEDWLVAIDYVPLLINQGFTQTPFWSRQEFSIQQAQTILGGSQIPSLGWNVQPYNVRIGKIGIFVGTSSSEKSEELDKSDEGEEQNRDIILDVHADHPISALWTDAVHLTISLLAAEHTDISFPISLPPDDTHPSIRLFPQPLQGSLKVKFSSISYNTLQGLASPKHGGGLHLSLLAQSSRTTNDDGGDDVEAGTTEPPDLAVMPTFTAEELSSSVAFLRGQIRKMTINEKRRRFMHMLLDESQREQFEKNVIGEQVETVLEPMLEHEDFVRRYMRSDGELQEDSGWIDPNAIEESKDGEDDEHESSSYMRSGSRLRVTDSANHSGMGWLSNTARSVWASFDKGSHNAPEVPSTILEADVDQYEDESETPRRNGGARVQMDGIHTYHM